MTRLFFALCATLTACAPPAIVHTPIDPVCNADAFKDLIGQDSQAANAIPDPKRVLPPNSAITKDYRPNRTNIDLDATGTITRIWCG